jgi:hypothetical protein
MWEGGTMRTSLAWIQQHPHWSKLRHILNTVNWFLYHSTKYLENRLLPNDLIIVRNHRDVEEDVRGTKDVLEIPRDAHTKVEIQSNSKYKSLTSSPTQNSIPPCLQIGVQDAYDFWFGWSIYAWKAKEIIFPMPRSHGQLKSKSPAIIKTKMISRTFLVLRHLFWADGPCIELGSISNAS